MVKNVTTRYGGEGWGRRRAEEGGGGGRGRRPLKEVGGKKAGKEEVKRTQCCANTVSGQKTCRHPRTGQVPIGGSSLSFDGRLINLFSFPLLRKQMPFAWTILHRSPRRFSRAWRRSEFRFALVNDFGRPSNLHHFLDGCFV